LEKKRLSDLALARELDLAENHRRELENGEVTIAEVLEVEVVDAEVDNDGFYEGIEDDNFDEDEDVVVQDAVPVLVPVQVPVQQEDMVAVPPLPVVLQHQQRNSRNASETTGTIKITI
jgi:hypothetical protein